MSGRVSGVVAVARVWDAKLVEGERIIVVPEHARKMVLFVLAERADDDGRDAFPSIETIASCGAMSQRAVRRALRSLIEDGFVAQRRQRRGAARYDLDVARLRAARVLPEKYGRGLIRAPGEGAD